MFAVDCVVSFDLLVYAVDSVLICTVILLLFFTGYLVSSAPISEEEEEAE